jgi:putative membrane protein
MISLARAGTGTAALMVAGVLAGGAGMLAAAPAQARTSVVSAQDATWAMSNAQTDLAEITIGGIAEQRALRSDTKMLAMVTMSDHEKSLAQLRMVAAQVGITLPTTPNAMQQAQAAQLKTVPSGQFDATFDSFQIQGHEQSISETKTEIANGSNAAVRNFAISYLPVAERHLQMAEADFAALGGTTGGTTGGTMGQAPAVSAGTGGMAATRPADDAPWLSLGAVGLLLITGTCAVGLRRRLTIR